MALNAMPCSDISTETKFKVLQCVNGSSNNLAVSGLHVRLGAPQSQTTVLNLHVPRAKLEVYNWRQHYSFLGFCDQINLVRDLFPVFRKAQVFRFITPVPATTGKKCFVLGIRQ